MLLKTLPCSLPESTETSFYLSFTLLIDREACFPVPPAGHRWKEVRHDNTVTWLASWTENIQGSIKYIMLNANSKLKVQKMCFCWHFCLQRSRWHSVTFANGLKITFDRVISVISHLGPKKKYSSWQKIYCVPCLYSFFSQFWLFDLLPFFHCSLNAGGEGLGKIWGCSEIEVLRGQHP